MEQSPEQTQSHSQRMPPGGWSLRKLPSVVAFVFFFILFVASFFIPEAPAEQLSTTGAQRQDYLNVTSACVSPPGHGANIDVRLTIGHGQLNNVTCTLELGKPPDYWNVEPPELNTYDTVIGNMYVFHKPGWIGLSKNAIVRLHLQSRESNCIKNQPALPGRATATLDVFGTRPRESSLPDVQPWWYQILRGNPQKVIFAFLGILTMISTMPAKTTALINFVHVFSQGHTWLGGRDGT